MSFDWFFPFFLAIGVLSVMGLWLYYEGVRRPSDRERHRGLFHCVRCGCLYSASPDEGKQKCPSCGFENIRLRF